MTVVVGRAIDFSQIDLQNYYGRVMFIPSGPGIRTLENSVIATRILTADLDSDGRFSINIAGWEAVFPDVHFKIRLEWFQNDPYGRLVPIGMVELPHEIRVPVSTTAVNVTDLIYESIKSGIFDVWEDEVDDPEYTYWFDPSTNNLWSN